MMVKDVRMGRPHYSKHGKISRLITQEEFNDKVKKIEKRQLRAFAIMLYYTGVRVGELTRAKKEQFHVEDGILNFDVGPREKTKRLTSPLQIPISAPLMDEVLHIIKYTKKGRQVFDINRSTAWRMMERYFNAYPHYFRLNRLTQFLLEGFSLPEVIAWSGHKNVFGLDAYIGQASVKKMGESLRP